MHKNFLIFGSPRIEADEIREVVDSLKSGWLSSGPKVLRFEEDFKKYMATPHAVAVNSCTAALFLSLVAAKIDAGDEVITTPFTFAATANVILHRGAKPVFVDVDPVTMNIDAESIEKKITSRTKAIVPVHFAGRPCNMNLILKLAKKHRLLVIQDAAHALETRYHGKKIGALGDLSAFSFYATKNLTTGEGGMVTTSRRKWAEMIQVLASQGMTRGAWRRYSDKGFKQYRIIVPGFKFNMMDMQAALGIHQLRKIEAYLKIREKVWETYDKAFENLPLRTPARAETGTRHARHLYTILLDLPVLKIGRDAFQQELYNLGIGTGVHFVSLHLHPYYRKAFKFKKDDFPNASFLSERTLSLPLSAKLNGRDIDRVISSVKKVVRKFKR
jgi:dTDP-4-amino-4,6-dideoxygalactose transaminase